jgi:hypothetical protein
MFVVGISATSLLAVAASAAILAASRTSGTTPLSTDVRGHLRAVPDVRGNLPGGRGIQPLIDAGFCVDFVYDRDAKTIHRDGLFETFSDTYVIGRQTPDPGSQLSRGSTVTVTVGGTPFGGPRTNWDAQPLACPPQ